MTDARARKGRSWPRFPGTRATLVDRLRSADAETRRTALDGFVRAYWTPVHRHVLLKWRVSEHDAEDLVQGFFARVHERGYLAGFDPGRSRLRSFVRLCVDRFVSNERAAARVLKRGGGATLRSLDEEQCTGIEEDAVAAHFEAEWRRGVVERALDALRARCEQDGHQLRFELLHLTAVEPPPEGKPTTAALARAFGITTSKVTNELHAARKALREALLRELSDGAATEEECRHDAAALLGRRRP